MIKNKKGVALIWALVLSSVLLLISSTMVSYIVKESQFSVRTEDSVRAYSYARSGIEWANYCIDNQDDESCDASFDLSGDGSVETTISTTVGTETVVVSESTVNDVTRRLEYKVFNFSPSLINFSSVGTPTAPLLTGTNVESFEMSFMFWQKDGALNPSFRIGADETSLFSDDGTVSFLGGGITSSGIFLNGRLANGLYTSSLDGTAWASESVANKATPYKYKATLKYLENTAASLKVERLDTISNKQVSVCISYLTIDLSSSELGNLKYLHLLGGGTSYTYIPSGEYASDYIVGTASNGVFIDNITFKN